MLEFEGFGKIPRYTKDIVITEKIDGTNAQVLIGEDGSIVAGSRNRYLAVGDDNFGFAGWVEANKEELLLLGPGRHFGEWWGAGIQRTYDLKEKRFTLFNVSKWMKPYQATLAGHETKFPKCCSVVPVLYQGPITDEAINSSMDTLAKLGSLAAPGFSKPEGIIIYHSGANTLLKKTFEDDGGKWRSGNSGS